MAASCQNCAHMVTVETSAMSVWVSTTESRCSEFIRSSGTVATGIKYDPLPCDYAMETFCHLTAWKPTLLHRIKAAFGRIL